jgi:hypothetical protein
MTTTYRRSGGLAVLVAAAAIGLAACGGGSSSPQVATLGSSSDDGSGNSPATAATSLPRGNPTQLLDQWAACMRGHGDPGQADPTINASKVININISPSIRGGYSGYSGEYGSGGPGVYCRAYLTAAQSALRGGQSARKPPDPARLLKFSECMRAHGVPDFPDPTVNGIQIPVQSGTDLDPRSPAFQNASKLCSRETGVPGFGGPLPPGTVQLDGGGPLPG